MFYIVGHKVDGGSIVIEQRTTRENADTRRDELASQLEGYTDIVVQAATEYQPGGKDEDDIPNVAAAAARLEAKRCRHCNEVITARAGRGLCRPCWDIPEIKEKYPPVAPFGGNTRQNGPTREDRINLLKERHEAMKANNGLPNQKLADMLRQMGPLSRLADAREQAEKEGMTLSEPTFYKYKKAIFPDAERIKPGPSPKSAVAASPPKTAARSSTANYVPTSTAEMKPLESLAEAIDVLGQVKTLIKRVGGADQLRELVDILA